MLPVSNLKETLVDAIMRWGNVTVLNLMETQVDSLRETKEFVMSKYLGNPD
jgi:hypothetical protein